LSSTPLVTSSGAAPLLPPYRPPVPSACSHGALPPLALRPPLTQIQARPSRLTSGASPLLGDSRGLRRLHTERETAAPQPSRACAPRAVLDAIRPETAPHDPKLMPSTRGVSTEGFREEASHEGRQESTAPVAASQAASPVAGSWKGPGGETAGWGQGRGALVEGGCVFRQLFSVRWYEVGMNRRASMETACQPSARVQCSPLLRTPLTAPPHPLTDTLSHSPRKDPLAESLRVP